MWQIPTNPPPSFLLVCSSRRVRGVAAGVVIALIGVPLIYWLTRSARSEDKSPPEENDQ
jgi:hypothetical protein